MCNPCILNQPISTLLGGFYDEYLKSLTAKISVSTQFQTLQRELEIWRSIVAEVREVPGNVTVPRFFKIARVAKNNYLKPQTSFFGEKCVMSRRAKWVTSRRLRRVKFILVFFSGSYEPVVKSTCQLLISAWDVKNCAWTEDRGIHYMGVLDKAIIFLEHHYPVMCCNVSMGSLSGLDLIRNRSVGNIS